MLEVEGYVSRVVSAGRGVLPGCSQSMPWVKIYVYGALEAAHYQNMAGREQELFTHALPAATLFAQGVAKLGLTISCKSALVCSSPAVGDHLAGSLQALRLPIRYRAETKDLGPCTTAGRRRRIPE
eukprot:8785216-Pyramimonas_sp.AAC.1